MLSSAKELLCGLAKSPDLRALDFHVFQFAGYRYAVFGDRFEPVAREIGSSGIADQHARAAGGGWGRVAREMGSPGTPDRPARAGGGEGREPVCDALGHVALVGNVAGKH